MKKDDYLTSLRNPRAKEAYMFGHRNISTDGVTFRRYCNDQIKSMKVAIDRKSRGSTVEDGYFMEHLNKLKEFFLDHEVYK